jgi:hypothetical protein
MKVLGALGVALVLLTPASTANHEVAAATTTATFHPPVLVSADDSQTAAEPSIRAARDGTLYIVAPTGLGNVRTSNESGGADVIWRSVDKGKSWEFLGSFDNQQGGGDADIAPDHDGVLWGSGLTLVNTTGAISTDKGETWKTNPMNSLSTVVDRQWIETYKSEPFAFMTTGRLADSSMILSRLERAPGDVPVTSKTVTVSGSEPYQWPGEIAVDEKNDYVFVAYQTDTQPANRDKIMVARTDLQLESRELFHAATTTGDSFDSFVGLDVGLDGTVYVVWTERRPRGEGNLKGRTNSYLAASRDSGKSWSKPLRLNRTPRTTAFPWVVAGSKGRVAVTYYGARRRGPSPEKVSVPDRRPPRWKVWTSYSLNALSASPTYTETRATPARKWLHEGNVCTSGTGCAAGTRDLLDFFQIDLDPCGKMVITYTDNSRDQVTPQGRTSNAPELIAFVGQKGGPRFYARPLNPAIC